MCGVGKVPVPVLGFGGGRWAGLGGGDFWGLKVCRCAGMWAQALGPEPGSVEPQKPEPNAPVLQLTSDPNRFGFSHAG